MEFYDVIEQRRTVRVFKKGIQEEQLQRIFIAGAKAPSAGGRQPWEFILIEDPEIIRPTGRGEVSTQQKDRARGGRRWKRGRKQGP